jgi:hypothetical protein
MSARFRDPQVWLSTLAADTIDVVCPRCGARAAVTTRPVADTRVLCWPRQFVCTTCLSTATWSARTNSFCAGGPVDPFFRLPLWRTAQCCGKHTLWAFNEAHLTLLHGYVSAKLRERGDPGHRMTLIARLPAWLKSAKHRDEVLRVLARLHDPEPSTGRR